MIMMRMKMRMTMMTISSINDDDDEKYPKEDELYLNNVTIDLSSK